MKPDKNHVAAMARAADAKLDDLTKPDAQAEEPATAPPAPADSVQAGEEGGGSPAAAQAMTPEQEARAVLEVLVGLALPFYPALGQVYTDDTKAKIAAAAGPVMAKYNWTLDKFLARWMAEINLAFVALPVLLQTVQVVRAANAEKKAAKEAGQEKKPEPAASTEPVSSNAPLVAGSA